MSGAFRRVLAAGLLLAATTARAELQDLGRYGPTCPVPPSPPPSPGRRIRLDPVRARVATAPETPMPVAAGRRTSALAVAWPPGAPPVVAFVGRDPVSLARVRTLPTGTLVFLLPSDGETPLEALQQACPCCRMGRAGTAAARQLGIRALPAVIRVVDGVAWLTEGRP